MALEKQRITRTGFEAFLRAHPDGLYELINGEIVEKVVTQAHAKLADIIIGELYIYLKQHPDIVAHMGPEARFSPEDDDANDRLPDVSLHLTDEAAVMKGPVIGMPDLAVEIKSPDDTYIQLRDKAAFYLANGTQVVWLVYPEKRFAEVYRQNTDVQILMEHDDALQADTLLPEFALPLAILFPKQP